MSARSRETPAPSAAETAQELAKLRKINRVLMDRVERDMDAQGGNAFSLFQTAITLEGRVAERTAELTRLTQRLMQEITQRREAEAALRIAKADAEQANLGKTRFLAAASHDLQQPLNAARLFLGALADEVAAGRPRELVGRIETALDSVVELLDTLVDISRLDTGAWPVSVSDFPVAPLLARLADEFAPEAEAFGLSLRIVPSSAVVHTDHVLFARLLRNLVSNAIRYTERGRVLVGCRREAADIVRVEVRDTGIGIPADKLDWIFEEFQRLEAPRRQEKGFGLGLATVQRIARLLSLDVSVRSTPGRGSCFSVRVPAGREAAVAAQVPSAPSPAKSLAGIRVVCIEDDEQTRLAMEVLLRAWGCEPALVARLDDALRVVDGWGAAPDLLIADYHLRDGVYGTDAVQALRERAGAAVPAIVVSGDRAPAVQSDLRRAGFGFLTKPVQPAKLRAMMAYVLTRQHAPETAIGPDSGLAL